MTREIEFLGGDVVFQKPQIDFCNGSREALQKGCYSQRAARQLPAQRQ
jgi:hypothetical protein